MTEFLTNLTLLYLIYIFSRKKLIAILAKKYDFDAAALRGGGAARSHNARVPSSAPWECVALHASVNRIGSIEECLLTGELQSSLFFIFNSSLTFLHVFIIILSGVLQHLRVLDLSANRLDDRSFGFNGGAMPHLRIVNLANNALRSVSCLGGVREMNFYLFRICCKYAYYIASHVCYYTIMLFTTTAAARCDAAPRLGPLA